MTFPKARLAVSAVLFASWIGFLGFLVYTSSKIILSRPQFLVAQMYVVVAVQEGQGGQLNPQVTIEQVLWPARSVDAKLIGVKFDLPELTALTKKQGYVGPGKYLIPLQRTRDGEFEIAPVPHTLNFATTPATHGTLESYGIFSHRLQRRLPLDVAIERRDELRAAGHAAFVTAEEIRIYPWNDGTRVQIEELIRAK